MKEQLQQTMTVKYSKVYRLDTIESLVNTEKLNERTTLKWLWAYFQTPTVNTSTETDNQIVSYQLPN